MSLFKDEKYENLDWISQATEPMESSLAEILAQLPETLELNYESYIFYTRNSYNLNIEVRDIMHELLHTNEAYKKMKSSSGDSLTYDEHDTLINCFEIQVDEGTILDGINKTLTGGVRMVKVKHAIDDKLIESMLGSRGLNYMRSNVSRFRLDFKRATDIMEIMGDVDGGFYRTRSSANKFSAVYNRLKKLLKENEWKIKDTELANKVGYWVADYIADGNLAAYTNFCKLKVMTHKGVAIYSMEEQQ
jgi:hypothetical protein